MQPCACFWLHCAHCMHYRPHPHARSHAPCTQMHAPACTCTGIQTPLSPRLAKAAAEILDLTLNEVLEAYGVYFVEFTEDQVRGLTRQSTGDR